MRAQPGRDAGRRATTVLLVGPDVHGRAPGGMATISARLIKAVNESGGFRVTPLTNFVEGSFFERLGAALKADVGVATSRASAGIVHIQVAHGRSIERDLLTALVARACGIKVVAQYHGAGQRDDYKAGTALHKWAFRRLVALSDVNAVLGTRMQQWLKGLDANARVLIVRNWEDTGTATDFPGGRPCFLFLGRIGERKGAFDLIEAALIAIGRGLRADFVLAGDGDVERASRLVASSPEVEGAITVLGWQDQEAVKGLLDRSWASCSRPTPRDCPCPSYRQWPTGAPSSPRTWGIHPTPCSMGSPVAWSRQATQRPWRPSLWSWPRNVTRSPLWAEPDATASSRSSAQSGL